VVMTNFKSGQDNSPTFSSAENTPKVDNKAFIKELLTTSVLRVQFTKKDGTTRVMRCTLKPDSVVPYEKKTDRVKEPNPDILPVWDLDNNAWRSITISSIDTVEHVMESAQ
jgi:hypothetical protein